MNVSRTVAALLLMTLAGCSTAPPAPVATPTPTPSATATPGVTAEPAPKPLPSPAVAPFAATVEPVPAGVAARSSWREECPVALADLRYVTMTYWGFDGAAHTGEMLTHTDFAADVVAVFEALYSDRFPITEMRIYTYQEVTSPGYGDEDNTSSFECRDVAGGATVWSEHAYGLAVDINPFENPYIRGDLLLPSGAGAFLDRDDARAGMIFEGDTAVAGFDAIGWHWGGRWTALKDWMHFSANGG